MFKRNLINALILTFALSACSSDKKSEELSDPQLLYKEARGLLNKEQYFKAAEKFEQLEREHPASELAAQAHMQRAYALYLDEKYDDAVIIIDEFVKQYPAHQVTPYMYYLKGLCYYDQILDVGRDQELAYHAIETFNDLIHRFPNSKYSRDAQLKIDYAYNTLAGKEMDIGRFYLKKSELIAALNRFKNVVDRYQSSIFITEALYRLAEIYYTLGDVEQAKIYSAVLGFNYPQSIWYKKAYKMIVENDFEQEMPWYKKVTRNIW